VLWSIKQARRFPATPLIRLRLRKRESSALPSAKAQAASERSPQETSLPNGTLFRLYLAGYLLFRFCIEFIKPTWKPYIGLSAIQLASLAGAIVCLLQLSRQHAAGGANADARETSARSPTA
jgi:hypothetical protein